MSTTIKFEAGPTPTRAQANADGPRKKRKRAPAQGAADDCFTCLNRSVKCDRRRPYCSQCLDGGQDCAGYKTQLTWGVGVASRGKLRGLSLPVAGTTKTLNDAAATTTTKTTANSNTNTKSRKRHASTSQETAVPRISSNATVRAATGTQSNHGGSAAFRVSTTQRSSSHERQVDDSHALRPLATRALPDQYASQDSATGASQPSLRAYTHVQNASPIVTNFSHHSLVSPVYDAPPHVPTTSYATPSPTVQYFQHPPHQPNVPLTPTTHPYQMSLEMPTSRPGFPNAPPMAFSDHADYLGQNPVYQQQQYVHDPEIANTVPTISEDDVEEIKREFAGDCSFSDVLSVSPYSVPLDTNFTFPLSGTTTVGRTPRMQYLIQYYAEVIAPVLVAFDNPSNPLRNQVLGLAARSEPLQHAISALSASNLRQRRESGAVSTGKTPGARRSSYMHQNLTNEAWDDRQNLTQQDRKKEETWHKYAAVRSLNQQLSNPLLRKDDSVLATLLILCLFHMCDSGIARFQTQFEGVKKLLTLRGNSRSEGNGDDRWLTRFFTWFDNLAATVNDREGQLGSQYVDISAMSDGDWSHETLTGVDGRLFKTMSRLGRLNILSQGKSPESNPTIVSRPAPPKPAGHSHVNADASTFDGNGWMRVMADEDLFAQKTAVPDARERFWREWHEVRRELLTWSLEPERFDGSNRSYPSLTPEQRFDMLNISESFRYSSLLYTERLADPQLSSSDPKIQGLVQKALYHIRQVRADVYLLWPLFITGSECVDEQDRSVIRERCWDIQNDSGFMNNSSCLALIEKVWRGDNSTDGNKAHGALIQTPFRFREVMLAEGNEGEWIVV